MKLERLPIAWLSSLCLAACGAASDPPFELRGVVAPAIAALEREVAAAAPSAEARPGLDAEDIRQHVRALVSTIAGQPRDWRMMHGDRVKELGDGAIPGLVTTLSDFGLPVDQRVVALQALSVLDTPAAAERLCIQLEASPEAWVRQHAAYELGTTSQDQCLPRLLARLDREHDAETRVWIAVSLAAFGCHAATDELIAARASAGSADLRAAAARELESLVRASGARDEAQLEEAWRTGEVAIRLRARPPGARARLDAWKRLAASAASPAERELLARLPLWIVEIAAATLHEQDPSLRGAAFALVEGLGPRAWSTEPVLEAALADPASAADAARALGAVRDPRAARGLLRRVSAEAPLPLRVECVRALGRLSDRGVIAELEPLLEGPEPELADVAAVAITELAAHRRALHRAAGTVVREPGFPRAFLALEARVRHEAAGSEGPWREVERAHAEAGATEFLDLPPDARHERLQRRLAELVLQREGELFAGPAR